MKASKATTDGEVEMEQMMRSAASASELLKALANENRLLLLCLLADGEKSVTELESSLELRQPTVSQQLARLRADNLVSHRRDGKAIYYSLASEDARRIIELLYEMYCMADSGKTGRAKAAAE